MSANSVSAQPKIAEMSAAQIINKAEKSLYMKVEQITVPTAGKLFLRGTLLGGIALAGWVFFKAPFHGKSNHVAAAIAVASWLFTTAVSVLVNRVVLLANDRIFRANCAGLYSNDVQERLKHFAKQYQYLQKALEIPDRTVLTASLEVRDLQGVKFTQLAAFPQMIGEIVSEEGQQAFTLLKEAMQIAGADPKKIEALTKKYTQLIEALHVLVGMKADQETNNETNVVLMQKLGAMKENLEAALKKVQEQSEEAVRVDEKINSNAKVVEECKAEFQRLADELKKVTEERNAHAEILETVLRLLHEFGAESNYDGLEVVEFGDIAEAIRILQKAYTAGRFISEVVKDAEGAEEDENGTLVAESASTSSVAVAKNEDKKGENQGN